MRESTFEDLALGLDRFREGLGGYARAVREYARGQEEWKAFHQVPTWFAVPTAEEYGSLDLPGWVAEVALFGGDGEMALRGLLRDAMKAGIPDAVYMEAWNRVLAPFCGHARSGGKLLHHSELEVPALKRALKSSIEAERIWLGLPVEGIRGLTPNPLLERLPNPMRGGPGLLASIGVDSEAE